MINGNYLSLDNILAIQANRQDKDSFYITYHSGKDVSFLVRENAPCNGELRNSTFYFKDKNFFKVVKERILKIIIENAA